MDWVRFLILKFNYRIDNYFEFENYLNNCWMMSFYKNFKCYFRIIIILVSLIIDFIIKGIGRNNSNLIIINIF